MPPDQEMGLEKVGIGTDQVLGAHERRYCAGMGEVGGIFRHGGEGVARSVKKNAGHGGR